MKFHPKKLKIKIVIDLIDVYQYHTTLKKLPKNSIHNCLV
jgi:hypothetical protein